MKLFIIEAESKWQITAMHGNALVQVFESKK